LLPQSAMSVRTPTRAELQKLAEHTDGPCVSIYMPTHPVGRQARQDPIRFKNALKLAEERLDGDKAWLERARELLDDERFWSNNASGLAVFGCGEILEWYRLPFEVDEQVIVAPRFHLRPLFPVIAGDGRFHLLALAQGGLRLFRGSRHALEELDTDPLPNDLRDALREDVPERSHETQVRSPGKRGANPDVFHGESVSDIDHKNRILRYFREVDASVRSAMPDVFATPLVLAGVEYLLPLYREASTHPRVVDGGVIGNAEGLKLDELHAPAWKLVEPLYTQAETEARARFDEFAGQQAKRVAPLRALGTIAEVVPAASDGRIDTLFVAAETHCWGRYDEATHRVEVRDEPLDGDEDLLDRAALSTFLNGGAVYAVPRDSVPGGRHVAAVLRY
jgi:hypothetical protein